MERGSWNDTQYTAYWGFLLGNFCASTWAYAIWMLVKRLWITTTLNLFDGKTNAVLALTVQFWDTGLLFYLRPYVDVRVNISECLGGLTNLLGYLAISTPILLDDAALPFIFGDFTSMLLATSATIISA